MSKKGSPIYKKPSLRMKKKDLTRKAILVEAEKILSEKMLSEINTGEIADAAVVSRTTIYNYFKNKDEIFFGIGTQQMFDINESFKTLPMELTGLSLILELCKAIITGSIEKPILFTILRDFYNRLNYHNIPIEAMHDEIISSLNTPRYNELLMNFKEPYLVEFYIQLVKFGESTEELIQKGKEDGSVTNKLPNEHIGHYIFILVNGILDELALRKSTFIRIGMERKTVISNTLTLIKTFLTQS